MGVSERTQAVLRDVYITAELEVRPTHATDPVFEKGAVQQLANRMVDDPEDVLPRFVDLAMEITGGAAAGISLYESSLDGAGFRLRHLRGRLARFEGELTPHDSSPWAVTLKENSPVLAAHPERAYDWISAAGIVAPEVLLLPLHAGGPAALGTLWIVSDEEGHFHRGHVESLTELATFLGIALRMLAAEQRLHTALEGQALLTQEMSHRVKNLFAVTDGMIRLSARSARDTHEMAEILSGRLHALASAHALVSPHLQEVGRPARASDIRSLLQAVIAPHDIVKPGTPSRFALTGPHLDCGDRAINSIALVFHELATNAVKYGALSVPKGRVGIEWGEDGRTLTMIWSERGGPSARHPVPHGFGSSLLEKTVRGQFGGAVDYDWTKRGLQVTLRLPLERLSP